MFSAPRCACSEISFLLLFLFAICLEAISERALRVTDARHANILAMTLSDSKMAETSLLERARRLGHEVFASLADDSGRLNRPLVRALGEQGLLQLVFDGSATELCELREGLAYRCTEAETALALQGLGGHPILRAARPQIADEWIPRLAGGSSVAAFALSEPHAGSDVASLALRAEPADDGAKGITAFVVPRDSDGLSGEPIELVAPHPVGRLDFDGVRVEPVQVLGEVGGGFKVAMETLDLFRPSVGAFGVGMAQAALDAAVSHKI